MPGTSYKVNQAQFLSSRSLPTTEDMCAIVNFLEATLAKLMLKLKPGLSFNTLILLTYNIQNIIFNM